MNFYIDWVVVDYFFLWDSKCKLSLQAYSLNTPPICTSGISIAGRKIFNLGYANDTTLIVSDEEEIEELVNLVKIASEKLWLRINASNTKVMVEDQVKCLPVSTALSE